MQIWPNLADILSADISACISADKIGRYDYRSYSTVQGWMNVENPPSMLWSDKTLLYGRRTNSFLNLRNIPL